MALAPSWGHQALHGGGRVIAAVLSAAVANERVATALLLEAAPKVCHVSSEQYCVGCFVEEMPAVARSTMAVHSSAEGTTKPHAHMHRNGSTQVPHAETLGLAPRIDSGLPTVTP